MAVRKWITLSRWRARRRSVYHHRLRPSTKSDMFLRNLWYYALPGRELRRGSTTSKLLLGEPLLIGRARDDSTFALTDVCPHRGMPLSYGRFDGCQVECAYHGWRFDTDGVCKLIPSLVAGQRRDLGRIRVKSFPCREVQGNIWVFFGDDERAAADPAAIPRVPGLGESGYQLAQSMVFPCPVDHAVVGLMDPAHGPFVHQSWWWRARGSIHEKSKKFEPSHLGFRMVRHRPSTNSRAYRIMGGRPGTEISFQLPGIRIEHVQTDRYQFGGLTAVTPIDEQETEVHHIIYWNMPWLSAIKPLLRPFARAFLNQDRQVVERQREGVAHNPRLMLINDADVQAKWYYALKKEFVKAAKERRAFENPVKEKVLRWRS